MDYKIKEIKAIAGKGIYTILLEMLNFTSILKQIKSSEIIKTIEEKTGDELKDFLLMCVVWFEFKTDDLYFLISQAEDKNGVAYNETNISNIKELNLLLVDVFYKIIEDDEIEIRDSFFDEIPNFSLGFSQENELKILIENPNISFKDYKKILISSYKKEEV